MPYVADLTLLGYGKYRAKLMSQVRGLAYPYLRSPGLPVVDRIENSQNEKTGGDMKVKNQITVGEVCLPRSVPFPK